MKRLIAITAMLLCVGVFTGTAAADDVWNMGGWIDENGTIMDGVGGNIHGGDGGTCSLTDVLGDCEAVVCDLDGWECDGEDGSGRVCYVGGIMVDCRGLSSAGAGDGNPNHEFVPGDPPAGQETTYIHCWEPEWANTEACW